MAAIAIGTTAVGAGASIYGASQAGKGAAEPPKPVDILKRARKGKDKGTSLAERQATGLFQNYYPIAIPLSLQTSAKYGPQIMGQMFDQTGQFLGGVNGQPGFQGLQLSTSREAGKTLAQLREEELAQMTGQTGMTRGLMAALSPEQAAAVQSSAQEAARARASAQGVTPEEQRMYQQTAREAAQASGRLGGNSAIAAEIMGRENVMAQKREEAAQAERQSYALAGEFYTNPGLRALQNAPLSYGAGQQDLRTALSLGPASSGDFDYNMPLSLAQQAAGAQHQYNQAVYQTNLANQQAKAQMWSGIGSSLMGAGMNMGGGSYGSMLGGGLSSIGGQTGNTGLYNYGANMYNQNIGYGTPQKAYIV
jgi:hypothetical protein